MQLGNPIIMFVYFFAENMWLYSSVQGVSYKKKGISQDTQLLANDL